MTKIAVILPSRGMMFSRTAEELLNNLEGYDYDIFFSHGLPIPLCFEKPTVKALYGSYSHLWYVEDDMILPEGTLDAMLIADVPVATMDYPVSREGQGVVFEADGRILFTGTGCLLVKREVFDIVRPPYFRTDVKWNAVNRGKFIRFTANKISNLEGYGLHDVNFGLKLYKAEIPISCVGTIGHRKLKAWGKAGTNDGAHQIEEWTKVKKDFLLKRLQSYPVVPIGKLITVMTSDGEVTVHPTHAKKLIKAGIAQEMPKRTVGVDYNEVELWDY